MTMHLSELERRFPHIAGNVVQKWGKPDLLRYLDALMVDERGGRQGFPFDVLQDIMLLMEIHNLNHPRGGANSHPWDFTV